MSNRTDSLINQMLKNQCKILTALTSVTTGNSGDIVQICKCNDVALDGSNIEQYVEVYLQKYVNNVLTSTFIGNYTDSSLSTLYTTLPLHSVNCSDLGTDAVYAQGRELIAGNTWSPEAMITSYTLRVQSNAGGAPTFVDSFGNSTTLYAGESVSYGNDNLLSNTTPVLTVPGGSIVIVTYTKTV